METPKCTCKSCGKILIEIAHIKGTTYLVAGCSTCGDEILFSMEDIIEAVTLFESALEKEKGTNLRVTLAPMSGLIH